MHSVEWLVLLQLGMWICKTLAIYHQKGIKYFLATVYMLEIPSIIRIIAEIDLLKLCDLKPQRYKVRYSNYFTYAYMVGFPKFGHILLSYTYIVIVTSII